MILNGFQKKSFFRIGMWNSRPPPLHGKNHLKFPFWFFEPFPKIASFELLMIKSRGWASSRWGSSGRSKKKGAIGSFPFLTQVQMPKIRCNRKSSIIWKWRELLLKMRIQCHYIFLSILIKPTWISSISSWTCVHSRGIRFVVYKVKTDTNIGKTWDIYDVMFLKRRWQRDSGYDRRQAGS